MKLNKSDIKVEELGIYKNFEKYAKTNEKKGLIKEIINKNIEEAIKYTEKKVSIWNTISMLISIIFFGGSIGFFSVGRWFWGTVNLLLGILLAYNFFEGVKCVFKKSECLEKIKNEFEEMINKLTKDKIKKVLAEDVAIYTTTQGLNIVKNLGRVKAETEDDLRWEAYKKGANAIVDFTEDTVVYNKTYSINNFGSKEIRTSNYEDTKYYGDAVIIA